MNLQSEHPHAPRQALLRQAAILQFKLLVDGLRDAVLIPLSIGAAAIGLLRGGDDADREFRRVIKLGRRSERWINLFGHESHARRHHPGGSLDTLMDRVEAVVMDQYKKGKSEAEAREAIQKAMQAGTNEESGEPEQKT